MKRLSIYFAMAIVALAASSAHADSSMMGASSMKPLIYTPTSIKWMPGTGEMKGLKVAVLEGDPSKNGPWTIRIDLPAATKFPVHYHADTERVTVISGAFLAAIGTKYDASKLMTFPAGSYLVIPAGVRHFAATKSECVIQLSGSAIFGMKMDHM